MSARCRGFSLVELLVVLALVTCFYAMVYGPSSERGQRKRLTQCVQQLQQMHAALALYAAEHDGAFPSLAGAQSSEPALSLLVPLYTVDTSIFICPGSGLGASPGAQPFADRRCSYALVAGLRQDAAPETPLVADALATPGSHLTGEALFSTDGRAPGNNHRRLGGNVLFVDGHVTSTTAVAAFDFPLPTGATLLNPRP